MTLNLTLKELNTKIVKCSRGSFLVADLLGLYNACKGEPVAFCRIFFAKGSNGRDATTMAYELFGNGTVEALRWVTSNIPLSMLVESGLPSLEMIGSLAARLPMVEKDEVFYSFAPDFFKMVPVPVLRAVRIGQLDLLQLLINANNKKAFNNVNALLNLAGSESSMDSATLRLERAEHELRAANIEKATLRHNLQAAQQTADELLAMRQEMYAAIDERDINTGVLRKQIINLDIERTGLARKEKEAEQRQKTAEESIAAARLARSTAEARVQTERRQREVVVSDLATTNEKIESLQKKVVEMERVATGFEEEQVETERQHAELKKRIADLHTQLLNAEEETDKTLEERTALKSNLTLRIADLESERSAISSKADAAAAELRQAKAAKQLADSDLASAKAIVGSLRARLDSMAKRTTDLERQLEDASTTLRENEAQLEAAKRQLSQTITEKDTSMKQHSQQVAQLRKENEQRSAELSEAQRLMVEASDSIQAERKRAEEALSKLSATSIEADKAKQNIESLRQREKEIQTELERISKESAEEKRRLKEENDKRTEGLVSQLSEARDRLERTRADLRNESDAKLQTERQNADLQRQLSEMAQKIDSLATGDAASKNATLERSTSVSTMKKDRPTGPAPVPAFRKQATLREAAGRPRTLRRTEKSSQLVSQDQDSLFGSTSNADEQEIATSVSNQRANYQFLKAMVEFVTTAKPDSLRTFLVHGASANTRDPDSRQPLLEIALRTYHGMHRDRKRLGEEAKKIEKQAATIVELLIQNGGEWADMDSFLDKLVRTGYVELGAEAKKAERSTALATQLPEPIVRKLDERDELAPFCQAVLKSSAVNVKKFIGSVTNLDRVPKQTPARGRRYIHIAVLNGNVSIVYDLVLHGADVCALDNDGCSPLRLALLKLKNAEARRKIVEYLLAGGADPNETCPTPLEDTNDSGDSGSEEQNNGSSTMSAAVLSRLRRPHKGKAAAKAAGKTSLVLAEELNDQELVVCMNSARFHKVTMGSLRSYIKVAVETAITVERMIVCGELKTNSIEHQMFEKYNGVFHSFNPQFIDKYGSDYTHKMLCKSLDITEGTLSDTMENEKIQKMLLADLQFVEASLRARSSSGGNLGNKTLHWKLLLALNQCILAVHSKLFEVSELLGDPARRMYNEAARQFLIEEIENDRADIAEYMLLKRRDRIFGDLDLESTLADVFTPIEYAARCGATATLEMLMNHQQSRVDICGIESGKTLTAIAADSEQPLAVVLIDHFRFKNQLTTQATPNAHNYAIVRKGQRKLTVLHLAVLAARKDLLQHCVDEVPFHLRAVNSAGQTPLALAEALLKNAENRDEAYKFAMSTCVSILFKAAEITQIMHIEERSTTNNNDDDDDDDGSDPPPPPTLEAPPPLTKTDVEEDDDEGSFDSDEQLYEQAVTFVVEKEYGDSAEVQTIGRRRKRRPKKIKDEQ